MYRCPFNIEAVERQHAVLCAAGYNLVLITLGNQATPAPIILTSQPRTTHGTPMLEKKRFSGGDYAGIA